MNASLTLDDIRDRADDLYTRYGRDRGLRLLRISAVASNPSWIYKSFFCASTPLNGSLPGTGKTWWFLDRSGYGYL